MGEELSPAAPLPPEALILFFPTFLSLYREFCYLSIPLFPLVFVQQSRYGEVLGEGGGWGVEESRLIWSKSETPSVFLSGIKLSRNWQNRFFLRMKVDHLKPTFSLLSRSKRKRNEVFVSKRHSFQLRILQAWLGTERFRVVGQV